MPLRLLLEMLLHHPYLSLVSLHSLPALTPKLLQPRVPL